MKQWEEDGRRYQAEAKRRAEAKAKPGQ
jgi:hypothetical protein